MSQTYYEMLEQVVKNQNDHLKHFSDCVKSIHGLQRKVNEMQNNDHTTELITELNKYRNCFYVCYIVGLEIAVFFILFWIW
jgi:hypothetical protein